MSACTASIIGVAIPALRASSATAPMIDAVHALIAERAKHLDR